MIENKNTFDTQKTLATELNYVPQMHTKIIPQKDHSVRLEITFTAEQFADLETAKSLLSHICVDGEWSDVVTTLAQKFIKKKFGGRDLKIV
jgi:hypothetical protein